MEEKIGIFGGSFDPIHCGHINIAQSAYEEFNLNEVWFIPAGHSPNKDENRMTPAEIRAEMVSLAIEGIPGFRLCDIEIKAKETSYTYLTLTKLKDLYPDKKLFFIMGADSLDYFERWYHPEIICQKAVILAAVRDDMNLSEINRKIAQIKKLFPARIYPISGGKTDISSSSLRDELSRGEEDKTIMLPPRVAEYIKRNHLYQS
ncbi:MAG: nicotinate-nucleotide adenylyltransferase [Clostridiales bacterium]|nr:nicotinate-nucleotide adenylyltransferase [Clostridiales bacterium]